MWVESPIGIGTGGILPEFPTSRLFLPSSLLELLERGGGEASSFQSSSASCSDNHCIGPVLRPFSSVCVEALLWAPLAPRSLTVLARYVLARLRSSRDVKDRFLDRPGTLAIRRWSRSPELFVSEEAVSEDRKLGDDSKRLDPLRMYSCPWHGYMKSFSDRSCHT